MFIVLRRSKSLNEYDEFDDDDDYFDNENSYVNWERHEECYEEFIGYDEDYDGRPTGYLTSFLPDGTSVSPKKVQHIKAASNAGGDDEGKIFYLLLFFTVKIIFFHMIIFGKSCQIFTIYI